MYLSKQQSVLSPKLGDKSLKLWAVITVSAALQEEHQVLRKMEGKLPSFTLVHAAMGFLPFLQQLNNSVPQGVLLSWVVLQWWKTPGW